MEAAASSTELGAADRWGLWLIRVGASVVAALHVAGLIMSGQEMLGAGPLEVRGLALDGAAAPELTAAYTEITAAHHDSVTITVEGVPAAARWLLWGEVAATSIAVVGICVALVWLSARVEFGRPFGRSVTVALLTTAVLIMVGGVTADFLGGVGRSEVVWFLGPAAGGVAGLGDLALEISLAPVGIGVALGVVVAAFEMGDRLQRDTAGLV